MFDCVCKIVYIRLFWGFTEVVDGRCGLKLTITAGNEKKRWWRRRSGNTVGISSRLWVSYVLYGPIGDNGHPSSASVHTVAVVLRLSATRLRSRTASEMYSSSDSSWLSCNRLSTDDCLSAVDTARASANLLVQPIVRQLTPACWQALVNRRGLLPRDLTVSPDLPGQPVTLSHGVSTAVASHVFGHGS